MITFIYPRDDWTAAETIMKMQALAASQGYSVYATPKNTIRDMDYIKIELSKTRYAIFIAIDADSIDDDTNYELSFLKDKNIETYYVVTEEFRKQLPEIDDNRVYVYEKKDPQALIESVNKTLRDIKNKDKEEISGKESNAGELMALLAILGILAFFLWLLFGKRD